MQYIPLRNSPYCAKCGKSILHNHPEALFDGLGYQVEDLQKIKNHHVC